MATTGEPTTLDLAFTKVRTQTNSGVAAVRRPAVLLTAIDSTLQQEDGSTIQPSAYLVALLSTLEQLATNPQARKEGNEKRELLEATLYLLSLLTPHLEPAILRTRSPTILPLLLPLFTSFSSSAPSTKSLLQISQSFLSSLPLTTLTTSLPTRTTYASILSLAADARPKVRRRAQEAITALLSSPPSPALKHPYGEETAGWILERLEEAVKGAKRGGKKDVAPATTAAAVGGKGGKGGKGAEAAKAAALAVGGEQEGAGGSDESRAIALLTFVKNLGTAWDDNSTPQLLPLLLSTLPLSSPHLTLTSLTLLSHLFSAARSADSMSGDHVEETLEALVNSRPRNMEGEAGERLGAGWTEGVGEGMVALARTNPPLALSRTSQLFPTLLPLLASASTTPLRQATETACELMIKHCITDAEISAAVAAAPAFEPSEGGQAAGKKSKKQEGGEKEKEKEGGRVLLDLIDQVNAALTSPRYAAQALPHVLSLAKTLFLRLRLRPTSSSSSSDNDDDDLTLASADRSQPAASTLLSKTLLLIGRQRESPSFEWKRESESVLDAAIKVLGPEAILRVMPLGLEEGANPSKARAWLLPLLKPSITNTRLGHFREGFVPLSAEMFVKAQKAREGDKGMEAKVWETLVGQIWALLPGYCEYPTDLQEGFDSEFIALLANVVYSQPSLRPSIFRALSTLISTTSTLASSTSPPELLRAQFGLTPQDGQASLAHLQALAATILGIAFNVYGKLPRGEGAFILQTVGEWLAVLPSEELVATYERVEALLVAALAVPLPPKKGHGAPQDNGGEAPPTHALLDILISLIPHSAPVGRRFWDLASSDSVLGSQDQAVQKKGYRILARLAEERGGEVVKGREGEVVERLVEVSGQVANGAKRDRTLLLSTLVPLLPPTSLHHIPSLIPEAVLGTKESNERTRESAYELIVGMGRKMGEGGVISRHLVKGMAEEGMDRVEAEKDEAEANMDEFVTMVSAGLAGSSPHMISATITSLSRLVFEFHTSIPESTLHELLTTIIIFLSSANREMVRSAIGYVKVCIVSLPSSIVEPSLPELIPALINWSHEHSNHFKVKIRHILERLIRKFGVEKIEPHTPEDDKKLVSNIRKKQARSKKKKAAREEGEDEEMDVDAEPAPKPQVAGRSAYDEVLYGSDSDASGSDDERAAAPAAAGGPKNRKAMQRKGKREEGAYIHEGDDEVLDLLDDRMMSKISAARPTKAAPRKPLESHFKTDESGRMRIEDDSDDDQSAARNGAISSMGAYLEAMRGEDGHTRDAKGKAKFNKTQGKRGRGEVGDDEDVPVTEGLKELDVGGRRQKKAKRETVQIGGEFKAKRAGGDVKKKDGVAPYAYVPLSNVAGKKSSRGPKVGITGLKSSRHKN